MSENWQAKSVRSWVPLVRLAHENLTEREASYESSGYSGDPKSDSVRILDGGKFAGLQMEFKKRTLMFKMVFLAAILYLPFENWTF